MGDTHGSDRPTFSHIQVKFRSVRIVSSVWLGVTGGVLVLEKGAQRREVGPPLIPHFPPLHPCFSPQIPHSPSMPVLTPIPVSPLILAFPPKFPFHPSQFSSPNSPFPPSLPQSWFSPPNSLFLLPIPMFLQLVLEVLQGRRVPVSLWILGGSALGGLLLLALLSLGLWRVRGSRCHFEGGVMPSRGRGVNVAPEGGDFHSPNPSSSPLAPSWDSSPTGSPPGRRRTRSTEVAALPREDIPEPPGTHSRAIPGLWTPGQAEG